MAVHFLKTHDPYFQAVKQGLKTFEVRRDDRGFQRGDTVVLQRYSGGSRQFLDASGAEWLSSSHAEALTFYIGWILTGGQFGLQPGFVAFSLHEKLET